MRFTWITLLVIIIDSSSKLLMGIGTVNKALNEALSPLGIAVAQQHQIGLGNLLGNGMNSGTLLLLAAVLAIFFFVFRLGSGFINISPNANIGIQLASGGILSQLIDLLLYGEITHPVTLHPEFFIPIAFGISELALLVGLLILARDFVFQRTSPKFSRIPLQRGDNQSIDFSGFPRGIDNVHIDVHLSPRFQQVVKRVLAEIVPQYLKRTRDKKSRPISQQSLTQLTSAFHDMVQSSMLRIKKEQKDIHEVDLLYVSVIKFIQREVHACLSGQMHQPRESAKPSVPSFARSLPQVEKSSNVDTKNVFFNVCNAIFGILSETDGEKILKLRRSLFGESDYLLARALTVPLLQAASAIDEQVMLKHYVLLSSRGSANNSFPQLDNILDNIFKENLVALSKEKKSSEDALTEQNLSTISISSEYQRALSQDSVLMDPANVPILLDTGWTHGRLMSESKKSRQNKLKTHLRFQRYQLALLSNTLTNNGLLRPIVAAYEVAQLVKSAGYDFNPTVLHKVLSQSYGITTKKRLEQIHKSTPYLPPLDVTLNAYQRVTKNIKQELTANILQFVRDFAAYRRDLQLDFYMQQAINQVNLLESDSDLLTSRTNHTLHEFLASDEVVAEENAKISVHAIVKADLRGSTQITEELTQRKLNPATHFSRYFFTPINDVIQKYGAEKVFIEGDAIILIMKEYDSVHSEHFCVSRACGLATDMLRVVYRQNQLLAGHNLPTLELGLGIAFNDTPPRYLFDNNTRITISPAINRADRLSSCHWAIKNWFKDTALSTTHVAVFEPTEKTQQLGGKAQKDMNYNLNGVLLEPAAYKKLCTEVEMRPIENPIPDFRGDRLYASRFPDLDGNYHSLIIRESPVRQYDPDSIFFDADKVEGRYYYEVIYDKHILEQLSRAGHQKRKTKLAPA